MTKGELLNKTLSALFLPIILLLLLILDWNPPNAGIKITQPSTAKDSDPSLYSPSIFDYKHPYLEKAQQQEDVNQYDSAVIYYREAAERFEKESNWLAYLWTNNQIANLYLNVSANDFTKSKPYLDLSRRAGKYHLKENHPFLSSTKYYYGLYHYKRNEADSALFYLNDALKDRIKFFGEQTRYVANIYNDIGNVYMIILFDATKAEKAFQKALKILERILPPEDPEFVYSFFNLTTISQYKRDFEKASTYSFKTIEKIKQLKVNKSDWEELMQGMSGDIFKESGKPKEAKKMYVNAIDLSESNNGNLYNRAYYYWRMGEVLLEAGSLDSAIFIFEKSLKISKTINEFDYGIAASVFLSLGIAASKKSDDRALYYLSQALEKSLGFFGEDHIQTADVYRNIGKYWMNKEKPDSASKYLQQALHIVSEDFRPTSIYSRPDIKPSRRDFEVLEILGDKADLLKKLYKDDSTKTSALESSLTYYHLIDSLISRFDLALEREKSKMIFSDFLYHFYEKAIDTCLELDQINPGKTYAESALYFIDRRKAYVLYKNIKEEGAVDEISRELKEDYFFIQSKIDEESNSGNPDRDVLSSLHSKLLKIEKQLYSDSRNQKRSDVISFYASRELMRKAGEYSQEHNAALLNYFWGDESIYISAVFNKQKVLIEVPLTEELESNIAAYRSALTNGFRWNQREDDFKNFCKSSFYIYNRLFKPVSTYFKETQTTFSNVTIVPDGPLSFIPFESLISQLPADEEVNYKDLKYLVKDFLFTYSYSFKLLFQSNNGERMNDKILALGYSGSMPKNGSVVSNQMNELPGAAAEISTIEKHVDGKFVAGSTATETVFKANAGNYGIIHLAIHGKSDDLNTYNSKLIFKKDPFSTDDGYLYPYELFNMNLKNVKLAVLSACESGEGKVYRGEGIYSLARGFIHSGCASVVMSIWRVNDQSSRTIMDVFYKELTKGSSIDQSLRLSKLNYLLISNSRTSHPSNWSSFISIGKTKARLSFFTYILPSVIIFFLLLAILIAVIVARKKETNKGYCTLDTL